MFCNGLQTYSSMHIYYVFIFGKCILIFRLVNDANKATNQQHQIPHLLKTSFYILTNPAIGITLIH